MLTSISEQTIQTLEISKDEQIAAPIDVVFETILEQMGPLNETPDGTPLPMTIEAWPGGRWFRDFGNNTGHLWGHVQSIKPPTLLEIYGPLFMSHPVTSHVLYRLTPEAGGTRMKFSHRAVGLIPPEFQDGAMNVNKGWSSFMTRIREIAEKKQRS
ncbi:MAG: SRPBCC domain-containing protein [Acidobacteriota bacterium]|nr:SRPBCC domain-containing protein [Acidobacteriota bacterium]